MLRKAFTDECTQAVQRADMGLIYVVWATGKATVSIVTLGLWLEALVESWFLEKGKRHDANVLSVYCVRR